MLEILENTCILLAKAEQAHFNYTKAQFLAEGGALTPVQWLVLHALYHKNGQRLSDLAKQCYLDNSTITGVIDRLEKSGYVTRQPIVGDRRSYEIVLLPKAYEIKQRHKEITEDIYNEMTTGCTDEELVIFRKVLLNIFDRLSK